MYAPTAHLDAAATLYRTLHVAGRVCTVFGGVTRMFDTGHRVHSCHYTPSVTLAVHTHRPSARARHRPTRHVQHARASSKLARRHRWVSVCARVSPRSAHSVRRARTHTRRCAHIRRASMIYAGGSREKAQTWPRRVRIDSVCALGAQPNTCWQSMVCGAHIE